MSRENDTRSFVSTPFFSNADNSSLRKRIQHEMDLIPKKKKKHFFAEAKCYYKGRADN